MIFLNIVIASSADLAFREMNVFIDVSYYRNFSSLFPNAALYYLIIGYILAIPNAFYSMTPLGFRSSYHSHLPSLQKRIRRKSARVRFLKTDPLVAVFDMFLHFFRLRIDLIRPSLE